PDLFVFSPEKELLGCLPFHADATATLQFLQRILAAHPELAPADACAVPYDPEDPAQRTLADLQTRWQVGERMRLVAPCRAWLQAYGEAWEYGAAIARYIL